MVGFQISTVCNSREQLEKRLKVLERERDELRASVDESHDRVVDLEQENARHKAQVDATLSMTLYNYVACLLQRSA